MKSCAVIPTLNEEKTIGQVIKSLNSVLDLIIVVNDNSTDNTKHIVDKTNATLITHEVNKGYDQSINSGMKEALKRGCKIIITCDADGQHQIDDIKDIKNILQRDDMKLVTGYRDTRSRWSEVLFSWYARFKFGLKDPLCGLKGYKRDLIESYGGFCTYDSIGTELVFYAIRAKFKWKQVPIKINSRVETKPRFTGILSGNEKILLSMWNALKRYH